MGDFFACSVRLCHTHIFQYGRFDKSAVLKYKGHLIHQCFFRNVAYVDIPYQYAPFLRVKKSCDDICKRCLAAAGRSYQCDCLPRFYGKRYIIERVFLSVIAVTNVFQCNPIIFRDIIHAAFR